MFKYAFFYFDGTLTQSEFGIINSLLYAMEKMGIEVEDRESVKKFIGPPLVLAFKEFCDANGYPFTVDSCPDGEEFDMGDASGRFTYNEDPDGTLIEYVETHRIPVVKKLGWFIDMKKRDASKPLPKFLFRMMGLVSRVKVGGK